MTELHTYRSANPALWSTPDWPAGPLPQADVTTWHHNSATGLLDRKEYADGKGPTYTHTTAGRLATRTWARTDTNGNALVTTYTHDPATGELTGIDYSDAITPDVAHTYGRAGQRLTTTDGSGTTTNGYSSTLQLLTETFDRSAITGNPTDVRTLHRDYETNQDTLPGRPASIRLTGGDHDYHIDYGFDPFGRFKTLTTQHGEQPTTATYHYLTNSHLLERVHKGPSLVTRYEYEPNRDVKTAVVNGFGLNPVPANLISRYAYTYNAIRRRTSITTSGTAFGDHGYNLIGYNPRSEVTRTLKYLGLDHSDTNTPVTAENRAYHYDELGNRISATEGTDTTHYQSNELNQYTSISNQTATSGISNPTYDADGNTIDDARFIHAWNGQNRLISSTPISLTNGEKRVQSDYDATGRRWRKRVSTWSGTWSLSETRLFWYDGWNIIEETVQLATQTNTVHYDWGLDLSGTMQGAGGVGGLLREHTFDTTTVNTYHLTYDANGNVGQLIDTFSHLAAIYEYGTFGGIVEFSEQTVLGHRAIKFSTKYYDVESQLIPFALRSYNSNLGRWLNRDPILEEGGINLSSFIQNMAPNGVDIHGLEIFIDLPHGGRVTIKNDGSVVRNAEPTAIDVAQGDRFLKIWEDLPRKVRNKILEQSEKLPHGRINIKMVHGDLPEEQPVYRPARREVQIPMNFNHNYLTNCLQLRPSRLHEVLLHEIVHALDHVDDEAYQLLRNTPSEHYGNMLEERAITYVNNVIPARAEFPRVMSLHRRPAERRLPPRGDQLLVDREYNTRITHGRIAYLSKNCPNRRGWTPEDRDIDLSEWPLHRKPAPLPAFSAPGFQLVDPSPFPTHWPRPK